MCCVPQVKRIIEFFFPNTYFFALNIYTKLWHSSSMTSGKTAKFNNVKWQLDCTTELRCP
jgi:hypothetical protein